MKRLIPAAFLFVILCTGFSSPKKTSAQYAAATDTVQRDYQCVLDSLGVGEAYTIVYVTSGCFHYDRDSIWVARTYTGFNAIYHGSKKTLTEPQAQAVRDFELEVNRLSQTDGGCTTVDRYFYRMEHGDYFLAGRDATCSATSFQDLLDELKFPAR